MDSLGILQPIIVKPVDDGFEVVAGHRRLQAAKDLGWRKIAAIITDGSDHENWQACMAENIFRLDLTPVEIAAAVRDMSNNLKYDNEKIARIMHKSIAWVVDQIELISWPPEILEAIHNKKISTAAARNLARIGEKGQRNLLLEYAVDNGASARTTAAWLQAYQAGVPQVDITEVDDLPPREITPGQEPYTPCVICDEKLRMTDMRYLPICPECQESVIRAVREKLRNDRREG